MWVKFTAPEDNYYTFINTSSGSKQVNYTDGTNNGTVNLTCIDNIDVNSGLKLSRGQRIMFTADSSKENYDVSVINRKATPITTEAVSTRNINKTVFNWYSYTAPITATYEIKSTDATGVVNVDIYNDIYDTSKTATYVGDTSNNFTGNVNLKKDQTVYFRVYTASEENVTANISVSVPQVATIVTNNSSTELTYKHSISKIIPEEAIPENITLNVRDIKYFKYIIPEDGYYTYSRTTNVSARSHFKAAYWKNSENESHDMYLTATVRVSMHYIAITKNMS